MRTQVGSIGFIGCCVWLASACTGEGTLEVTAYGEAYIEQGIAADAFSDGWAVQFDRFDVSLSEVRVAGQDVADTTVDLTEASDGEGQRLARLDVEEGSYDDAQFTLSRVEVEGRGEKDGVTKSFLWVFEQAVSYAQCETSARVRSDETSTFQITVHADHLFYDSLVAEEPALVFQPFADADRNQDGVIETDGELWEASIGALDPGNERAPNLWVYLILAARSLGHANGEAHCVPTVPTAE